MDEAFAHLEGNKLRNNKKTEIPPDGGWGYVVCIGVGFTFVSIKIFTKKKQITKNYNS